MYYSYSLRISSTKKLPRLRNHQRAQINGLKTAAKEEVKEVKEEVKEARELKDQSEENNDGMEGNGGGRGN